MIIENISNQLHGYAQEAVDVIKRISKEYGLDFNEAAKAVEIAAREQLADVFHHCYLDGISCRYCHGTRSDDYED